MAETPDKPTSPSRSGVFDSPPDPRTEEFTQSISFDRALYKYDIAGSIAHARMLAHVGLIKPSEAEALTKGLSEILVDIEEGRFEFRQEFEDIHMNIEHALEVKIGEVAGKLHTARSRNDQISLDERLWIRDEIGQVLVLLARVQAAFLDLATEYATDVMPGYTHLQRAQPVTCGHYLLAFVEMLERDKDRFFNARRRANILPLGACALAGSSLPIDRRFVASLLHFDGITRNSMDTTADRDFLLDFAYAMSVCSIHLSRLCEDFILFSTKEFQFLSIADGFCTGSSIMPQKRNPDILELIRGKTGRSIGCLNQLFIIMKGLPLTYNRDTQEDKECLFDATRHFKASLNILEALLRNIRFRRDKMSDACAEGFMDATSLAEYLVRRGIPFRQAHFVSGKLVKMATHKGVQLSELDPEEMKELHSFLGEEVRSALGPNVVSTYRSEGSANPNMVRKEIENWQLRLKNEGYVPSKPPSKPRG